MIKLRQDNKLQPRFREGWSEAIIGPEHWSESEPFFTNPRGILIHRVRSVRSYKNRLGVVTHYSLTCLCGSQLRFDDTECLVASPPGDRLLCGRCEIMATQSKLPSAADLAGRHVHIGRLVAKRTCCLDHGN